MATQQIPRVKVTLNKYISTWEGKVLRYLHDHHPSKRNASGIVMELLSAAWLPYAMRFFGASDNECKEAASYSARFLLSHACSIVSEFGLAKVEMQGLLGDSIQDYSVKSPPSTYDHNIDRDLDNNAVYSDENLDNNAARSEEEPLEEDDYEEDEDGLISISGLDAGFRS